MLRLNRTSVGFHAALAGRPGLFDHAAQSNQRGIPLGAVHVFVDSYALAQSNQRGIPLHLLPIPVNNFLRRLNRTSVGFHSQAHRQPAQSISGSIEPAWDSTFVECYAGPPPSRRLNRTSVGFRGTVYPYTPTPSRRLNRTSVGFSDPPHGLRRLREGGSIEPAWDCILEDLPAYALQALAAQSNQRGIANGMDFQFLSHPAGGGSIEPAWDCKDARSTMLVRQPGGSIEPAWDWPVTWEPHLSICVGRLNRTSVGLARCR